MKKLFKKGYSVRLYLLLKINEYLFNNINKT